jgi:hypothetical protein
MDNRRGEVCLNWEISPGCFLKETGTREQDRRRWALACPTMVQRPLQSRGVTSEKCNERHPIEAQVQIIDRFEDPLGVVEASEGEIDACDLARQRVSRTIRKRIDPSLDLFDFP